LLRHIFIYTKSNVTFFKLNHDHFNEIPDVRDLSNVCYSLFFGSVFSLYLAHHQEFNIFKNNILSLSSINLIKVLYL